MRQLLGDGGRGDLTVFDSQQGVDSPKMSAVSMNFFDVLLHSGVKLVAKANSHERYRTKTLKTTKKS